MLCASHLKVERGCVEKGAFEAPPHAHINRWTETYKGNMASRCACAFNYEFDFCIFFSLAYTFIFYFVLLGKALAGPSVFG